MKKILFLFSLILTLSACKKDCSQESYMTTKFLVAKKTDKGILVKNTFIYPVHIYTFLCDGAYSKKFDVKILSGLSHTFPWEQFEFRQGSTTESIEYANISFRRDMCDYKNVGAFQNGEVFSVKF